MTLTDRNLYYLRVQTYRTTHQSELIWSKTDIFISHENNETAVTRKITQPKYTVSGKKEAQLLLGDRATRKHAKDCWNGRENDNLRWNDL